MKIGIVERSSARIGLRTGGQSGLSGEFKLPRVVLTLFASMADFTQYSHPRAAVLRGVGPEQ